jgi:hypothetical protein
MVCTTPHKGSGGRGFSVLLESFFKGQLDKNVFPNPVEDN